MACVKSDAVSSAASFLSSAFFEPDVARLKLASITAYYSDFFRELVADKTKVGDDAKRCVFMLKLPCEWMAYITGAFFSKQGFFEAFVESSAA